MEITQPQWILRKNSRFSFGRETFDRPLPALYWLRVCKQIWTTATFSRSLAIRIAAVAAVRYRVTAKFESLLTRGIGCSTGLQSTGK
jgi:hypothetical protein